MVDRDARTRITVALVGLLVVAACLLAMPLSARADGDPASDLLQSQTIFLPADANARGEQSLALSQLLRAADRAGVETRVAVIASDYDLGSVNALWGKPQLYARFLGTELSGVYGQRLLVVMPDGFGFSWPGHRTAPTYRLLARLRLGPRGTSLLGDAEAGVRAVAAAAGAALTLPVAGPRAARRDRRGGGSPAGKIAIVAILTVTILATLLGIFGRRLRGLAGGLRAAATRSSSRTRSVVRPRRQISVIAVLAVVIAAAGVVLGTRLRRTANPSAATLPFSWPPGRRPAPAFRLTDQNGEPVSLASYRGRPVIITFVDPLCRNFCPLAAHVLNQIDRSMPPARRPAIIAVSVDIYADTHADLMQDYSRWGLVPQWHWAVGSPRALAAVWKRYEVGVSVQNKRIAGTTVHFVTHDELAYIIDPNGYERALFYWPYAPQDVERTLHRLVS